MNLETSDSLPNAIGQRWRLNAACGPRQSWEGGVPLTAEGTNGPGLPVPSSWGMQHWYLVTP